MTVEGQPGAVDGQGAGGQTNNVDPAGSPGAQAGSQKTPDAGSGEPDGSGWDESTKAYIQKLRGEAADRRTKNKELETKINELSTQFSGLQTGVAKALGIQTDLKPEEQLERVQGRAYELESENFMLRTMMEKGINSEQSDYFTFLLEKRAAELGENEEMTDDMVNDIVANVKKVSAFTQSTSVSTTQANGQGPSSDNVGDGPTVDEFVGMSVSEKSLLYAKNPAQYDALLGQARKQHLL